MKRPPRRRRLLLATLCALLFLGTCVKAPPRTAPPGQVMRCRDGTCPDRVSIQYLGVGGFLIRYGRDAILTAPFFSNPSALPVLFALPVRANPRRIDAAWAQMKIDTSGIRAILVGHSHYDHLMDVPHIARNHLPGVPIYGNEAMRQLLAADTLPGRLPLHPVEHLMGDYLHLGQWVYPHADSTVRFMPVATEHAPHVLGRKLFRGRQKKDRPNPPENAWQWAEGNPMGFVVDFLAPDKRTIRFRVHLPEAASTPHLGFPPPFTGPDKARYDLVILCGSGVDRVDDYPEVLLDSLKPRHVVVGHWESFFSLIPGTRPDSSRPALGNNVEALMDTISRMLPGPERHVLPSVGSTYWSCICPQDETLGHITER